MSLTEACWESSRVNTVPIGRHLICPVIIKMANDLHGLKAGGFVFVKSRCWMNSVGETTSGGQNTETHCCCRVISKQFIQEKRRLKRGREGFMEPVGGRSQVDTVRW